MVPLRVAIGWCLSAALLFLSSTLLFCHVLRGILQPDMCRRLQSLIGWVAQPLTDLLSRLS